jgi:ParB family chromosome partitioning protein
MFAANQIVKKALSVREAEALAMQLKKPVQEKKARAGSEFKAIEERLRKSLGTKVSITARARGGKIVIEYYSNEELERILEKIG